MKIYIVEGYPVALVGYDAIEDGNDFVYQNKHRWKERVKKEFAHLIPESALIDYFEKTERILKHALRDYAMANVLLGQYGIKPPKRRF